MKRLFTIFSALSLFCAVSAQTIPTVKTNARYARGATMAFGRMTVTGISSSKIAERGFCYSTENKEPTVDDACSTKTLTNKGTTIYWLKDLTPATKYYMRPYCKSKDGGVGYGEVIKFYTIPKGEIKLSMRTSGDANSDRIKKAAETALEWWNNLTEIKDFTTTIGYNSGTPTAECSYGGWMSVGSNTSYQRCGTIMHELLHGVGVIPWADTQWSRHELRSSQNSDGYGSGYWLGDRVTEVLRFWDNDNSAKLNGDYQHMWPYGINGASEDNGSDVLYIGNALICQALGEDGLEHTDSHFAEPYYAFDQEDDVKYYIKNEDATRGFYTSYLVENADGSLSWKEIAAGDLAASDDAAWYVTFTPKNQFYQFRNAATGNYLYLNGSTVKTIGTTSSSTDFHLMRSRIDANDIKGMRGYWLLHHAGRNPNGIAAGANGKVTSAVFNIANNATTQRWMIMTAEETGVLETETVKVYQQQITEIVDRLKAMMAVPHVEDNEGIDVAMNAFISEVEEKLASTSSVAELSELVDQANAALVEFLSNATPSDITEPFDLTWMLQNPGLDAADGWSTAPAISYSCGEFYEKTFDMNQTLKNMPAGTYVLHAQAFQRPGSSAEAWTYYSNNQSSKITTFLYAGTKSVRVKNICADAQTKKIGTGTEVNVGSNPVYYIPNNMQAVAAYFLKGYYENEIATTVSNNGGSLKVGIRCSTSNSKYWSIFDNFRLYYFGDIPADQVTAVESVTTEVRNTVADGNVYDLQGRRIKNEKLKMKNGGALPKGIYIINGKKVVIK